MWPLREGGENPLKMSSVGEGAGLPGFPQSKWASNMVADGVWPFKSRMVPYPGRGGRALGVMIRHCSGGPPEPVGLCEMRCFSVYPLFFMAVSPFHTSSGCE